MTFGAGRVARVDVTIVGEQAICSLSVNASHGGGMADRVVANALSYGPTGAEGFGAEGDRQ